MKLKADCNILGKICLELEFHEKTFNPSLVSLLNIYLGDNENFRCTMN